MSLVKQLFSEKAKLSLMRVLSASIVYVALGIIIGQSIGCDTVDWMGCCSLVALGLSGKAGQKYLEKDDSKKHISSELNN